MLEHILVPTDGSALCTCALDQASELATRLGCRLTVLHVVPDLEVPLGAADGLAFHYLTELDRQREARDTIIRQALEHLSGVPARGVVRYADGRPVASAIIQEADALGADLIVMSTHGRTGLRRLLAGSVAETVVHHARQPVLLTHAPPRRIAGDAVGRARTDERAATE